MPAVDYPIGRILQSHNDLRISKNESRVTPLVSINRSELRLLVGDIARMVGLGLLHSTFKACATLVEIDFCGRIYKHTRFEGD